MSQEVTLLAMVHAQEGRREQLRVHESRMLSLVGEHGGEVKLRAAASVWPHPRDETPPDEVHLLTFPHPHALEAFLTDPRRSEAGTVSPVAKTTVWSLEPID